MLRGRRIFVDRVRAILAYGNHPDIVQQNVGTAGVRQALGDLFDNMKLGGSPAHNVIHQRLKIFHGQLVPSIVDDLVQLLQKKVPDSGFSVDMTIADIARQPRECRENPRNSFKSMVAPLPNLPSNTLTLAATLELWPRNITGFKAVPLLLNALANPDPWPSSNIELRVEQGCTTPINRRHIADLRVAMLATRFVGTIYLHGLPGPFEQTWSWGSLSLHQGHISRLMLIIWKSL